MFLSESFCSWQYDLSCVFYDNEDTIIFGVRNWPLDLTSKLHHSNAPGTTVSHEDVEAALLKHLLKHAHVMGVIPARPGPHGGTVACE
jgi:hypothetical protein